MKLIKNEIEKKEKPKSFTEEQFMKQYNKGLNDVEISKILKCSSEKIRLYRKKKGLDKNFKYSESISKNKLLEYVEQGLSDYKISEITGLNHSWIFQLRKKYNIIVSDKRVNKAISITKRQEEILMGHILGDGYLRIAKDSINVSGKIEQGSHQKEYAEWKYLELQNLCTEFKFNTRKEDSRTNKIYSSYSAIIKANPELNKYYNISYIKNKKTITKELVELMTPLSFAVLFMDDGYKTGSGYSIALNSFNVDEISILGEKLKSKFNIDYTIHTNNNLYISSIYRDKFISLIGNHIIPSMKYKLH